jgi:hypothetical protein
MPFVSSDKTLKIKFTSLKKIDRKVSRLVLWPSNYQNIWKRPIIKKYPHNTLLRVIFQLKILIFLLKELKT